MSSTKAVLAELEDLTDQFGNQSKVAELLDVDKSAMTRWLTKGQRPDPENEEQIAALRLIVLQLLRIYQPETAMKWLLGINAHLRNARPVDLIRKGHIADVLSAIQQDSAGSYA